MKKRLGDKKEMPDVPKMGLVDALAEIWSQINYAAYHMAYVRVYSQSEAMRNKPGVFREQEQSVRDYAQTDIVICRAHLAAFFYQLEHVFEALRTAIKHGKEEHPKEKYFWSYEKRLDEIEEFPIRQEIKDYRNMGHQHPAVIGTSWDDKGNFLCHFLPTIGGHEPKESIDLNNLLSQYLRFTADVCLEFAPGEYKEKFPTEFKFPVTVPNYFTGELPNELKGLPRLEIQITAT
jgi:hypothetical protein